MGAEWGCGLVVRTWNGDKNSRRRELLIEQYGKAIQDAAGYDKMEDCELKDRRRR